MGLGDTGTEESAELRLRRQLADAWVEIKGLRRTVAHQARQLSLLEPETSPAAPSLNCCYWLFSLAHCHEPSWRHHWARLQPTLRGLGTVPAPELTPIVWSRHLAARRFEVQRGGGTPCDHTLNIELGRTKGLLDWAVENQMIKFNPLRAAKRAITKSQRDTRLRPDDIDRLLAEAGKLKRLRTRSANDAARVAMMRAAILCWHDSMLRFNEARRMRRDLIEPNGDYPVSWDDAKTDAGERIITLTPRTLEAIRAVPVHPETNYVFVNQRSKKLLSEGALRKWFRMACMTGHLDARASKRDKRITPHHLRHAGATLADEAGVRAGALQIALGHAHPAATARYLHRDKALSARHVAEIMASATSRLRRGPKRAMGADPEKVNRRAKSD